MENKIQIFKNSEFGEIRTVQINDEPWFVGKDISTILGYENPTKAIRDHVDSDDKKMGVQNVTPSVTDNLGRMQYPTWINESGLYSLILSSKLPSAKKFKRWVTSEVLPCIRRHGIYMTTESIEKTEAYPDIVICLATALKEERERHTRELQEERENGSQ